MLLTDANLASDNPSPFRKDLVEKLQKLTMTINDRIRDEELQNEINRYAAKNISFIIEQSKFTYSPLGKANKSDSRARKKKQVDAITNQNGRLAALTNKDDHKNDHRYIYKEYLIKYSEENLMD